MIVLRILTVLVAILSLAYAEYHVDDVDADILPFYEVSGPDQDISSEESSDFYDESNDFDVLHYPFPDDSLSDIGENATRRKLPTLKDQKTRRYRGRSRGKAQKASDLESILTHWFKHHQQKTADKNRESTKRKSTEEEDESGEPRLSPLYKPYWPNMRNMSKKKDESSELNLSPVNKPYRPNMRNMPHKRNKKYGTRKASAKYAEKTKMEQPSNRTDENREPVKNRAKDAVNKKPRRVVSERKKGKYEKKLKKAPKKASQKMKTMKQHSGQTSRRFLARERTQEILRGRVVVNWKEGSEKSMVGRLKDQILSVFAQIREAIASIEPILSGSGGSGNETDGSTSKNAVFNVMIEQPQDPRENDWSIERESEEEKEQSSHQHPWAMQHVHKHNRTSIPAGLHKPVEDLSSSESEENNAAKKPNEGKEVSGKRDEGSSEGSDEKSGDDDKREEKLEEKLLRELRKFEELARNSTKDQKDTTEAREEEKQEKNKKRHRHVEENVGAEKLTTDEQPKTGTEHLTTIDDLISAFNDILPDFNNTQSALVGSESSLDQDLQSVDQHRHRHHSNHPTELKAKSKPPKS